MSCYEQLRAEALSGRGRVGRGWALLVGQGMAAWARAWQQAAAPPPGPAGPPAGPPVPGALPKGADELVQLLAGMAMQRLCQPEERP